jgi:hypothetical protein
MFIQINADGTTELREPDDFKNFKIVVVDAGTDVAAGLKGVAALDPDGKSAWVSAVALKTFGGRARPPDWCQAFDKMVESVRRFGWVRDDGTVRAHIEVQ